MILVIVDENAHSLEFDPVEFEPLELILDGYAGSAPIPAAQLRYFILARDAVA